MNGLEITLDDTTDMALKAQMEAFRIGAKTPLHVLDVLHGAGFEAFVETLAELDTQAARRWSRIIATRLAIAASEQALPEEFQQSVIKLMNDTRDAVRFGGSYDTIYRLFRDKVSQIDQLKGRYTGSQLRSQRFYVSFDDAGNRIAINPRRPVAPWLVAALPGLRSIPAAFISHYSESDKQRASYTAVLVRGDAAGAVSGYVRRSGKPALDAQPVTDSLITHLDAARARGLAILGDYATTGDISMDLPVLPGVLPILKIGECLGTDFPEPWAGIVAANTIKARLGRVDQSVTVERVGTA